MDVDGRTLSTSDLYITQSRMTSGMGRLDNRRKTEDVMDVNHLGCAGLIGAVEVDISLKKKKKKKECQSSCCCGLGDQEIRRRSVCRSACFC